MMASLPPPPGKAPNRPIAASGSKRKNILIGLALVTVIGAVVLRRQLNSSKTMADSVAEIPSGPAPVAGYRVRPRAVSGHLSRNGTLRAKAETHLQFGSSGRITRFDAEKGQFVKKGSLICQLDPSEAKNLMQAAELEFQKASWKYFKDRTIDKLDYEKAKLRYNQARIEYEKTSIRAPHNGYLVEKWVNVGEHVDPGTAVGKLMDKSRVFVEMSLNEDDIRHLKMGQSVEVTVDALPGYKAEGTVQSITPYLQGQTRSFNVKVNLPENPNEALSPGMFARCSIHQYRNDKALTVPREAAVEATEQEARIFVIDETNVVHAKTLPVLFMEEEDIELSGLLEGEVVVLRPSPSLAEGSRVSVTTLIDPASEMAASDGKSATQERR